MNRQTVATLVLRDDGHLLAQVGRCKKRGTRVSFTGGDLMRGKTAHAQSTPLTMLGGMLSSRSLCWSSCTKFLAFSTAKFPILKRQQEATQGGRAEALGVYVAAGAGFKSDGQQRNIGQASIASHNLSPLELDTHAQSRARRTHARTNKT